MPGAAALHPHVGCGCSGPGGQEEPCAGTGVHSEPGPPHAQPCAEPGLLPGALSGGVSSVSETEGSRAAGVMLGASVWFGCSFAAGGSVK